jgi:integrase
MNESSNNIKRDDPKVPCRYCNSPITKSNMSSHVQKNCIVKKEWGKTKADIDALIEGESLALKLLEVDNEKLKIENRLLNEQINAISEQNLRLKNEMIELQEIFEQTGRENQYKVTFSEENMKCLFDKLPVKFGTKDDYEKVWRNYLNWCGSDSQRKNPVLVTNANDFLLNMFQEQHGYTFYLAKYRSIIQSLLRKLTQRNILLYKFRGKKVARREKTFLTMRQINELLDMFKHDDSDLYIACLFQAEVGGRFSGIANLKLEHIRFYFDHDSDKIFLPETKAGRGLRHISESSRKIILEFLEDNKTEIEARGGYLFYAGDNTDEYKRTRYLMTKMNKKLDFFKSTWGLKKLTTHDLRASWCENSRDKLMAQEILKKVSHGVGHTNTYVTQTHYLTNINLSMDEVMEAIVKLKRQHTNQKCSVNELNPPESEPESENSEKSEESSNYIQPKKLLGRKPKRCRKSKPTPKSSSNVKKSSKVNFIVAKPSKDEKEKLIDTLEQALKSKNIKFNDDLVFHVDSSNPKSKLVQVMPPDMIRVFKRFKKRSRLGIYGPFEVAHSSKFGYYVKTTNTVEKFTLICEYTGTVTDHEATSKDNDAVMNYLTTENSSFVINPDLTANLGRFLCGVNNKTRSKQKQNVNSILYNIEGSLHVILYASRKIDKGEILYYDYNAGSFKEYETDKFQ